MFYYIVISHWLSDFVFQTDNMAKRKSFDNQALFDHVLLYSVIMTFSLELFSSYIDIPMVFKFFLITFVTHFCTDYITSRINKRLWEKGDVHNFFVSVGFDQLIHYVTLYLTLNYLKISF